MRPILSSKPPRCRFPCARRGRSGIFRRLHVRACERMRCIVGVDRSRGRSSRRSGLLAGQFRQNEFEALAPRPPCPAGRCRCRTWATARTTGSPAGIRTPRSPPRSHPARCWPGGTRVRRIPPRPDTRRRRRRWAVPSAPTAVDNPPMSPRSQLATSGSRPIAACSAACSEPGMRVGSIPLSSNASGVIVYITAMVGRVCSGMSSSTKSITSPDEPPAQVADHLVGHRDRHQAQRHRVVVDSLAGCR